MREVSNEQPPAALQPAGPSGSQGQSTRRSAAGADGRVARYVVLDGPGAIASVGGRDLTEPAVRARVASRARVLRAEHAALRPELEALGAEEIADVVLVANVIQIRVPAKQLASVERLAGVKELQTPTILRISRDSAVPLVGAPEAWEMAPGLHGEGMRIGILDTGVDYLHADLGGSGLASAYSNNDRTVIEPDSFPTAKVIGGTDLAGDNYDASGLEGSVTPTPDDDPLDCGGHGTHVAGIAAGTGVLDGGAPYSGPWDSTLAPADFEIYPGVAPAASLFAIKIFGCSGSTDLVLAAFELAADPNGDDDVSDRLDVVNASFGSGFALGSGAEVSAIESLTAAGSLLVAAAGNDGSSHFTLGYPASVAQTLSVAASLKAPEGGAFLALEVTAPDSVTGIYPLGSTDGEPSISTLGSLTAQVVPTAPELACDPLTNAAELDGKIALVRRGSCTFNQKCQNAADAGAVAVIVIDSSFNDLPLDGFFAGDRTIPIWGMRRSDGDRLWTAAPVNGSVKDGVTIDVSVGPDYIASFSSRGPTADTLLLKPDISAPGLNIFSTLVGSGSQGTPMSGTSMATPMTTGAVALLRQGRPALGPLVIKELLTSTAKLVHNGADDPYPTSLAGTGRFQIDDALVADISARTDDVPGQTGVSFGAILATDVHTETRTVVVSNHGDASADLDVSVEPNLDWPGVTLAVDPSTISVAAGGSETVELSLTVDPDALPAAPTYDPFTSPQSSAVAQPGGSGIAVPNILVTEASGLVVFAQGGSPAAVVAYQGEVRAAGQRTVDSLTGCEDGAGTDTMRLTLAGTPAAHDNATSVLEFGTDVSSFSDPDGPDGPRDIVAVGALSDPDRERVYFGVVTAADWVTPARGWQSEVGIEIDVDGNQTADFLVTAESFNQYDAGSYQAQFISAPFARVVNLTTGALSNLVLPLNSALAAYPGGVFPFGDPPETHETEVYFNRVLVFPVSLADLGLDATSNGELSYRGVSNVSRYPLIYDLPMDEPLDTTDWVSFDAAAPELALPSCHEGTPLCPDDDGGIDLALTGESTTWPTLLVLHHANGSGPRYETVDPSDATFESGDLAVQADTGDAGAAIDVEDEASSTFTVSNASGTSRAGVVLTLTVTNGDITSLDASTGSCTASACELGSLADGASATVTVTALPAEAGTMTVAAVLTSAHNCDTDTTNDLASTSFEVTEGSAGCGCRVGAAHSPAGWVLGLGLLLVGSLRRRRRRLGRK